MWPNLNGRALFHFFWITALIGVSGYAGIYLNLVHLFTTDPAIAGHTHGRGVTSPTGLSMMQLVASNGSNITVNITSSRTFGSDDDSSSFWNQEDAEMHDMAPVPVPGPHKKSPSAASRLHCPHAQFRSRHWCRECGNDVSALAFSMKRLERGDKIKYNHVAVGQDIEFAEDLPNHPRMCKNTTPIREVFKCDLENKRCMSVGKKCDIWHSAITGHMEYTSLMCREDVPQKSPFTSPFKVPPPYQEQDGARGRN